VVDELEVRVTDPVLRVGLTAREKVVGHVDTMALGHEAIDQVGANEARAARHQNALLVLQGQKLHLWIVLSSFVAIIN
jgi:hypothetical protein